MICVNVTVDADTPQAGTPPENIPVLWTAGVLEYVFEHRDGDRSAPRKMMRANRMLLQAIYASELLIGCVSGAPAGVEGVGRRYLMLASDDEAAAAYLSEARPAGSEFSFLPASVISPATAARGQWRRQRDAWTEICAHSQSVAIVINPAGPHAVTVAAAAFQMGKPRRFGQAALPEASQFQQPHTRADARKRAQTALAAVAAADRARPQDLAARSGADAEAENSLRDPFLRLALAHLDARAELDRGETEVGLRRLLYVSNDLWKFGAPERCIDTAIEALSFITEHEPLAQTAEILQIRAALTEILGGVNSEWRAAQTRELLRQAPADAH